MSPRRGKRQRGFTLIEVLVAFAVAALVLSVLLPTFSAGLGAASRAKAVTEATLLAESSLDAIGTTIPLAPGRLDDVYDGRYRWHAEIAARPDLAAATLPVAPYEVTVTVAWNELGRERHVALHTLRLGPGGEERAP